MIAGEASAFAQVVGIDVLLAGDNAIAVGALAAGLVPALRRRALLLGIGVALALRIAFALGVTWLLTVPGIMLIGGVLLLVVAFRLGREALAEQGEAAPAEGSQSFWRAAIAIAVADISLSIDNVLGVAGAARDHQQALVVGLVLSVVLMGAAATVIAKVIQRHAWIIWIGVGLIALVGVRMIVDGFPAVAELVA